MSGIRSIYNMESTPGGISPDRRVRRPDRPSAADAGVSWSALAGLYEPGLVGKDDRLNAVAQVQLGEDVRDVGADSCLA